MFASRWRPRRTRAGAALIIAAALLLGAGCSRGQVTTVTETLPSSSSSSTTETLPPTSDIGTMATYIESDADYTWSPVEALPAAESDAIAHFLAGVGLRMLFPSHAPESGSGSVVAVFTAWHTVPTEQRYIDLFVRDSADTTLIHLQPALSLGDSEQTEDVFVRSEPGRFSGDAAGGWRMSWKEKGQSYLASSDVLSLDDAIAWLETWYTLPGGDTTGEVVWTDMKLLSAKGDYARFSEGLVALQVDFKMGYLDTTGAWVIERQFADARPFSQGLAAVELEWGGPWGFIDKTGALAVEPQFYSCGDFSQGLAWAQREKGSTYGFIDQTGVWVIQPTLDAVGDFSQGLAPARRGSSFGYINRAGDWVIEPRFSDAGEFSEGLAAVQVVARGPYGYADTTGAVVIEPQFARARGFSGGLAAVGQKGLWGFIDGKGEWQVRPQYVDVGDFSQGLAVVYSDGGLRSGYIDKTGAYAIEPRAGSGQLFTDGLAAVNSADGDRYIDPTGAYAFDGVFPLANPFSEGFAIVSLDSSGFQFKWGFIDASGTVLWSLE